MTVTILQCKSFTRTVPCSCKVTERAVRHHQVEARHHRVSNSRDQTRAHLWFRNICPRGANVITSKLAKITTDLTLDAELEGQSLPLEKTNNKSYSTLYGLMSDGRSFDFHFRVKWCWINFTTIADLSWLSICYWNSLCW